jgi:hypothetical protein
MEFSKVIQKGVKALFTAVVDSYIVRRMREIKTGW